MTDRHAPNHEADSEATSQQGDDKATQNMHPVERVRGWIESGLV